MAQWTGHLYNTNANVGNLMKQKIYRLCINACGKHIKQPRLIAEQNWQIQQNAEFQI